MSRGMSSPVSSVTPVLDRESSSSISIWDYILSNQLNELQTYVTLLQSKDDALEERDCLTQKIIDGRVESSVRFEFQNPIVGQHGYLHVNHAKSTSKFAQEVVLKGSSPLHFAVHLRYAEIVAFLLEAGSDPSLLNEKHETPYRLARIINDDRLIAVFHHFRSFSCKLRKDIRLATSEIESSRKKLAQYQADISVLTQVRATLMAQVVALWWRYITSIVRRQNVMNTKHQLASQLENLMTVSGNTIGNLEKEKRNLLDERSALLEQVESLTTAKNSLESALDESKTRLSEVEIELGDRNALKSDLNTMRSQLKSSVELITTTLQQQALLSIKDGQFDPQKLLQELKVAQSNLAEITSQAVKDKAELALKTVALEQSKASEAALKTELDFASKRAGDYKLEIAALRAAASVGKDGVGDVQSHPEFLRIQKQLEISRKEIERLRSAESKWKEESVKQNK